MSTRSVWPMMENMILPAEGESGGGVRINHTRLRVLNTAISYALLLEREQIPEPTWSQNGLLMCALEALTQTSPGGAPYGAKDVSVLTAIARTMKAQGPSVFSHFTHALSFVPMSDNGLLREALLLSAELESSYGNLTRFAMEDESFKAWTVFSTLPGVRDDVARARGNMFTYLLWTRLGVFSSARWSIPPPWSPELASKMLDMGIISLDSETPLAPGECFRMPTPEQPGYARASGLLYAGSSLAIRYAAEEANLSPYAVWRFATTDWTD